MMSLIMPPEPRAPRLQGQTILVVDDQAQIRSLVRRTLEGHGAVVLEAANGQEALAVWKRHAATVSLAIVDFLMPGLSGLDLALILARDKPDLKILYMSSAVESIAMESLLRRSPEKVLLKPFTLEELFQRVVSSLELKHSE